MFSKFAIITLLVAVARCSASGGVSSFSYGVSNPNTGDVKDQHEKRVGDSVVGQYSLLEADGTKRIVKYSSNPQTGFNAIVKKDPAVAVHPSGFGYNGASPIAAGLGYGGANPQAYGGLNAWNPAGNLAYPGYANGAYGAYDGYGSVGNGWNQNSALNGYKGLANGWSPAGINGGYGSLANGWAPNVGANGGFGALTNDWNNNNYAATGAYGANGWAQNNGGYGSYGYGGQGPYNSLTAGYGAHGAAALSYSNRNSGW